MARTANLRRPMTPFRITPLLPHHAPLVERWSAGWGEPSGPVDPSFWPVHSLLVSSSMGQPLVLGFLFLTDSRTAFIAGILGNPLCDKIDRRAALRTLIGALEQTARGKGYMICISTTSSKGLKKVLLDSGWSIHEESLSYLVKIQG